MMNKMKKLALIMALAVALLTLPMPAAHAAEATVYFGSASYSNVAGERFNIGVYIEGDESVGAYEIVMTYDPTYLQYVSGATSGGDGTIVISGTAYTQLSRTMLTFRALASGSTTVQVTSASGVAQADGTDLAITINASAPITLADPAGDEEEAVEEVEEAEEVEAEEAAETEEATSTDTAEEATAADAAVEATADATEEADDSTQLATLTSIEEIDQIELEDSASSGLPSGLDIILALVVIEVLVLVLGLLSRKFGGGHGID